jgi:hypothetical protein
LQKKAKDSKKQSEEEEKEEEEEEEEEEEKKSSNVPANAGSYWNVDPSKKRREFFEPFVFSQNRLAFVFRVNLTFDLHFPWCVSSGRENPWNIFTPKWRRVKLLLKRYVHFLLKSDECTI